MPHSTAISALNLNKSYRIWCDPTERLLSPLWASIAKILPSKAAAAAEKKSKQGYQDFYALSDISFEVKRGEAVGIVGRNGAGKSTLLQLIASTLQPSSGSINVHGRVAALLELGAGFNLDFTGRENVFLSGAILGLSQKEMESRFDEVAAFAEIGDFIDQPVKTYSSGMMMRLAFAVNTCVDPDILIVDEALSVGDAPFQAKCFRRLRQLIEQGVSLLFVSHDLGTVRSICSRALWLKDGKTEMWGEAKDVAKEYEKFCWQEEGVILEENTAESAATSSSNQSVLSQNNVVERDLKGEFHVAPSDWVPPKALFKSPSIPHDNKVDRYGTRAVIIDKFICTNQAGEPSTQFKFNEIVTLHYLFRINKDINSDIVLGIRIKDTKDNYLFSVQDITHQHHIQANANSQVYAHTSFKVPLTHDKYLIKTGIFGFRNGNSRPNGHYDYSQAILWDIIEDGYIIEVEVCESMPLVGPVHAHADLHLKNLSN